MEFSKLVIFGILLSLTLGVIYKLHILRSSPPNLKGDQPLNLGAAESHGEDGAGGGDLTLECHVHKLPSGWGSSEEKSWYCNDGRSLLDLDLAVRDVQVFRSRAKKGEDDGAAPEYEELSQCKVLIQFNPVKEEEEEGTDGDGDGSQSQQQQALEKQETKFQPGDKHPLPPSKT